MLMKLNGGNYLNNSEYKIEFKEFFDVFLLLEKQRLEILNYIESHLLGEGLSEDLMDRLRTYEISLRKLFSMFNNINPPKDFKTAHALYLQTIAYRIQNYECTVDSLVAAVENDVTKVREANDQMDHLSKIITKTDELGWVEFKKAAGMK